MFTQEQISSAHAKIKSGADFPEYIRDIRELGVIRFRTHVRDCHSTYYGSDDFLIESAPQYETLDIADELNIEKFKKWLKDNQEWKNTFYEFCHICAESGIAYWIMNLIDITCTYYDLEDNSVLMEVVPS